MSRPALKPSVRSSRATQRSAPMSSNARPMPRRNRASGRPRRQAAASSRTATTLYSSAMPSRLLHLEDCLATVSTASTVLVSSRGSWQVSTPVLSVCLVLPTTTYPRMCSRCYWARIVLTDTGTFSRNTPRSDAEAGLVIISPFLYSVRRIHLIMIV